MLYHLHELQRRFLNPLSVWAQATSELFTSPYSPLAYTPVSRRQDRPNAILWLVRNHPELKDAQIMRLVGTTKSTIQAIRERTHWNAPNLQPMDPVEPRIVSRFMRGPAAAPRRAASG